MMKLLHFALTHLPHASEGTETRWKHGRAYRRAEHELSALSDSDLRDYGDQPRRNSLRGALRPPELIRLEPPPQGVPEFRALEAGREPAPSAHRQGESGTRLA